VALVSVPTAQQFICRNCCAKNAVVQTGVTPSQPGLLPVTRLLD
jgi:hypothetical protein